MATPFPFTTGQVLTAAQMNAITTLPINDQTASYTLVAGDAGERVIMNSASATTITVPNSVFSASQIVQIINKGAGVCTVTAGAGTTVSTTGSLALAQNATGTLIALSASAFIFEAGGVTSTPAVVQVKSTAKTDTFTTTSTSFTDVTGLTVSITPTSASNKIYVIASVAVGGAGGTQRGLRLARGGSAINVGDAGGGRTQAQWGTNGGQSAAEVDGAILAFLDSPATTSATTYSVQAQTNDGYTVAVNRFGSEAAYNLSSTITVMEVTP